MGEKVWERIEEIKKLLSNFFIKWETENKTLHFYHCCNNNGLCIFPNGPNGPACKPKPSKAALILHATDYPVSVEERLSKTF